MDDGTTIKLISQDQKAFELLKKNAMMSTLVKLTLDQDPTTKEVMVAGVQGHILEKVIGGSLHVSVCLVFVTQAIEYMNHHEGVHPPLIETPLPRKARMDLVPVRLPVCVQPFREIVSDEWDVIFIDKIGDTNRPQLYDLILVILSPIQCTRLHSLCRLHGPWTSSACCTSDVQKWQAFSDQQFRAIARGEIMTKGFGLNWAPSRRRSFPKTGRWLSTKKTTNTQSN
jgi:hypothetical protein